jgi:aspartyl-tRNA(Asn)/glutamyl-tRNA(Gln) amidotransferase subunit C
MVLPQGDGVSFEAVFSEVCGFLHMSLAPQQIESIAALARLALKREEIPAYTDSLNRILAMVDQLQQADTGDVAPMAHPLAGQAQRLRADAATSGNSRELYQRNAPAVETGLYLVPRVIE